MENLQIIINMNVIAKIFLLAGLAIGALGLIISL
jgi:ABC-type lipoprotein release transport system permease subunit